MENLKQTKGLLRENLMVKLALQNAYFSVPLPTDTREHVRSLRYGILYEFLCLCFGLGLVPRILSKLPKILIALLQRINIRLIIYLDDILIMRKTLVEILIS